ncbi:hypothetical protein NLG97_g9815 [Lecanicillium saksenae]|uniref:Uncharacterized protein n=1 Tax=Lecanicillium saksenae TaxID=468837 RepID=A0ACC1QGT3_9HYPO|nr:hypothetical protein NLG97_g9815 [Lecanicillium saksenae]
MSTTSHPNVAISAPGKVLLAGGYLVLDRKYTGLVFGLNARINVVASQIHSSEGVQLNEITSTARSSWRRSGDTATDSRRRAAASRSPNCKCKYAPPIHQAGGPALVM